MQTPAYLSIDQLSTYARRYCITIKPEDIQLLNKGLADHQTLHQIILSQLDINQNIQHYKLSKSFEHKRFKQRLTAGRYLIYLYEKKTLRFKTTVRSGV